jgi:hypothetical protein
LYRPFEQGSPPGSRHRDPGRELAARAGQHRPATAGGERADVQALFIDRDGNWLQAVLGEQVAVNR